MAHTKKIEFILMLLVNYNSLPLSSKILEGKTFDVQKKWLLNWTVFGKAIEPEIEKT